MKKISELKLKDFTKTEDGSLWFRLNKRFKVNLQKDSTRFYWELEDVRTDEIVVGGTAGPCATASYCLKIFKIRMAELREIL